MSQINPAIQVLDDIRAALSIDDEWTVPVEDGFSWWAYRLVQSYTATPAVQVGGRLVSTVRISTPVVTGVDDDPSALLSLVNQQAVLNALVWNPSDGTIVECCTAEVTDENARWIDRPLATAAIIQNTGAHSRAHAVAEATGGEPAATAHPLHGERPDMDGVVDVPDEIARHGEGPSAFAGPLTGSLPAFAEAVGLFGSGDAEGFTCEVPFTGARPVATLIGAGEPPETSLVRIDNVEHPQFGSGALVTLSPLDSGGDEPTTHANELNLAELNGELGTSLLGAWCADSTEPDDIAFNTFIPNDLAEPNLLQNFVIHQAVRSQRLAHHYGLTE